MRSFPCWKPSPTFHYLTPNKMQVKFLGFKSWGSISLCSLPGLPCHCPDPTKPVWGLLGAPCLCVFAPESPPTSLRSPPVLSDFSHVWLFVTLGTGAHQSPLPTGFSRQESWSGLPCPSPGDLPNPGIELASLVSPVLAGRFFTTHATWEALLADPINEEVLPTPSRGNDARPALLGWAGPGICIS